MIERRHLGGSRVEVTRLGLGGAPLGNLFSAVAESGAAAAVNASWDLGIRFFDTAPLYGHGLSEQRIGRALATVDRRDEYVVSTKVGRLLVPSVGGTDGGPYVDLPPLTAVFDFSADAVLRSLESSLERLGLDRVDIVHVHDPDDHADAALAGAFPALRRLRDEGVVGAIGAGMNQSAMLTRFVQEAGVDCVLLAGRYTLLDQSAMRDLLPACEAAGVSVIAAGVFNSGLLADPWAERPTYDYGEAPPELVERARVIAIVCRDHGVPITAAALQFSLRHPAVASVLMGARSAAEVATNVAAFSTPIPPGLWDDLSSKGLLSLA